MTAEAGAADAATPTQGRSMPSAVRIGIDLGGTGTRFVALDVDATVVAGHAVATPRELGPDAVADFLDRGIRVVAGGRPVARVGIGASGPVDRDGVIRNPDTLPAFTGVDLLGPLGNRVGRGVAIDNDAVTAALYEQHLGAARGMASVLMITLGTGVGVAALHNGAPVRGADGEHPEAGHLSVAGREAPCYCGRGSCWEQVVSRAALQRACASVVPAPTGTPADIAAAADAAGTGDPAASALFTAYGDALGDGIADLLTVFRSACVVIGGSAAAFRAAYEPALALRLARIETYGPRPDVRFSAAGDFGGAVGAALLP